MKMEIIYMWLSLLSLSVIDFACATEISTVIVLLSMVKKRWHTMIYIIITTLCYIACSFAIYIGVDAFIKQYWQQLNNSAPLIMAVVKVTLGGICILGFIYFVKYAVDVMRRKKEFSFEQMLMIKSVNVFYITGFSIVQMVCGMPFCYPILAFIGIMSAAGVPWLQALIYILVFSIPSLISKLAVYIMAVVLDGERFQKAMDIIKLIFTIVCLISLPILCAILAWICLQSGIPVLL